MRAHTAPMTAPASVINHAENSNHVGEVIVIDPKSLFPNEENEALDDASTNNEELPVDAAGDLGSRSPTRATNTKWPEDQMGSTTSSPSSHFSFSDSHFDGMSYDEVHRSVIEAAKARVAEAKETRNYDDGGWAALMQMVAERMVEEEKRKAEAERVAEEEKREAERMAELEAEFKVLSWRFSTKNLVLPM